MVGYDVILSTELLSCITFHGHFQALCVSLQHLQHNSLRTKFTFLCSQLCPSPTYTQSRRREKGLGVGWGWNGEWGLQTTLERNLDARSTGKVF